MYVAITVTAIKYLVAISDTGMHNIINIALCVWRKSLLSASGATKGIMVKQEVARYKVFCCVYA